MRLVSIAVPAALLISAVSNNLGTPSAEEKAAITGMRGIAVLSLDRFDAASPLILDTMHLRIVRIEVSSNGSEYLPATFSLGQSDPILGVPLTIQLPDEAVRVRIEYFTSPDIPGWIIGGTHDRH